MKLEAATVPDIETLVQAAVSAALERKAIDLQVLHLEVVTDFTDYFVLASGANERQVQAMAEAIDGAVRRCGARPLHIEGLSRATWVLMDFGDFLVHLFDESTRRFYALERLWGDAPDVTDRFAGGGPATGA
jgi:ribosome-associated protein